MVGRRGPIELGGRYGASFVHDETVQATDLAGIWPNFDHKHAQMRDLSRTGLGAGFNSAVHLLSARRDDYLIDRPGSRMRLDQELRRRRRSQVASERLVTRTSASCRGPRSGGPSRRMADRRRRPSCRASRKRT
jgi:hypothetical protein